MESVLRKATIDRVPDGTKVIETFGFTLERGYCGLPQHLDRMQKTAQALGYPFDLDRAMLATAVHVFDRDHRCRLTLDAAGEFEFSATPFAPTSGVWSVAVASETLCSGDVWLTHKTTNRAIYDTARANLPTGIDELIFFNERDELCEGTITNVIVERGDGTFVTPPLRCGLLPGVGRACEIAKGNVEVGRVSRADLKNAARLWLVNSLRGRIAAKLMG